MKAEIEALIGDEVIAEQMTHGTHYRRANGLGGGFFLHHDSKATPEQIADVLCGSRLRESIAQLDSGNGIERALHEIYDATLKEEPPEDFQRLLNDLD